MRLAPLAAAALCAALPAAPAPEPRAEAEVRAVVERFRTAIVAKDQAGFLSLFHGEAVPWLAVYDDDAVGRIRKRRPDFAKAKPLGSPGPVAFMRDLVASEHRMEETFRDVRVDTDGEVASVTFDYTFEEDGQETNHGREAWQLLRTERGWKIASVVYSVRLNPPKGTRP